MPIYEYQCRGCRSTFEQLVLPKGTAQCPTCQSEDLERLLSQFGVSSEGTRQTHLNSERKKQSKVHRDKMHAEHDMIHHHHH